jgi:hypothetical protein
MKTIWYVKRWEMLGLVQIVSKPLTVCEMAVLTAVENDCDVSLGALLDKVANAVPEYADDLLTLAILHDSTKVKAMIRSRRSRFSTNTNIYVMDLEGDMWFPPPDLVPDHRSLHAN